jgi:hypothetical protein
MNIFPLTLVKQKAIPATREQWLNLATDKLRQGLFKEQGFEVPEVKVSIGWPSRKALATNGHVLGQHWHPDACQDKVSQIFLSPRMSTSINYLETLVHELVHACRPDDGHNKHFRKIAVAVGLTGKMRATKADKELIERLNALIAEIGELPHAPIKVDAKEKTQGTRMIKCSCRDCGYVARTTKAWLVKSGAPICPCNTETMLIEQKE